MKWCSYVGPKVGRSCHACHVFWSNAALSSKGNIAPLTRLSTVPNVFLECAGCLRVLVSILRMRHVRKVFFSSVLAEEELVYRYFV